jgi:hypothetical protein
MKQSLFGYNLNKFSEQLSRVNWSELEGFNDPNQSCKAFHSKFTKIYNTCFPEKRKRKRKHKT